MHRIGWTRGKVTTEDKILEVGAADNAVWRDTPFNVVTLDSSIRPEEQCFPNIVGLAESLPFRDKSFDICCCSELIEHVPEPQEILREAVRVARKKVITTVPWEHQWHPDLRPFWNPGHIRFYTPYSFRKELEALGLPFKIEEIRERGWAWLGAEIHCQGTPETTTELGQPETAEMLKLNLGSFVDTIGYGWENIDILSLHPYITPGHKFRMHDLRQGISYPDNSVSLIRCSHLIEHLDLGAARKLAAEMHRVLIPGGIARISTPDLDLMIKHYRNKDMDFFNPIQPPEYIQAPTQGEKFSMLMFSLTYEHKAVYNFEMLRDYLMRAGFATVERVAPGFSRSEVMIKETQDQHEIISLIVEAIK